MVFAFLLAVSLADWVPTRWWTSEPQSLKLLEGTPINCLLVEQDQWNQIFKDKAEPGGRAVLGVIRPGGDALAAARRAADLRLAGIVLEGEFPQADAAAVRQFTSEKKLPLIELTSRKSLSFDRGGSDHGPITGTYQGVWPGIRAEHPLDNS